MNTPLQFAHPWCRPLLTMLLGLALATAQAQSGHLAEFKELLSAPHRSPSNVARDPARHPAETLAFFGLQRGSTVVEILPGSGGYYTEILAPWLRHNGRYIAADRDDSLPQYIADQQKMVARYQANPALFDQIWVTRFRADRHEIAPPGSADFVLSFRNLHNWMERDELPDSLAAIFKALKPGGVFGLVDHRGRTDLPQAQQMATGYVRQDVAIALIEKAGFRFTGSSEINANPKDTKDHPEGVWTLPPTYRLKEVERAKYQAIGESDRFTLRFVKP